MFLQLLTSKTNEEMELSRLLDSVKQPSDIHVVGRGTVVIEPENIFESPKFKEALDRAASIIKR